MVKKYFLLGILVVVLLMIIGCSDSKISGYEPFVGEWYTSFGIGNEECSNKFFETYGKVIISDNGKICVEYYNNDGSEYNIYKKIPEPKSGWTFTSSGYCHNFWIYDNWLKQYSNGKIFVQYDVNSGLLKDQLVIASEEGNSFHTPQKHYYKNLQDVIANCEVDKNPDQMTCSKIEDPFPCMSEKSRSLFPVSDKDITMDFETGKKYRELLTQMHEGKIDKSDFYNFVESIISQE